MLSYPYSINKEGQKLLQLSGLLWCGLDWRSFFFSKSPPIAENFLCLSPSNRRSANLTLAPLNCEKGFNKLWLWNYLRKKCTRPRRCRVETHALPQIPTINQKRGLGRYFLGSQNQNCGQCVFWVSRTQCLRCLVQGLVNGNKCDKGNEVHRDNNPAQR